MQRSISSTTRGEGFTLLELLVAFALLALFILPVLQLVHQSRVRAHQYSVKREVQNLAQQKLFERIYYYSEESVLAGQLQDMSGDFAAEGHPDWQWEIPYPEMVNQGEQILLQYTIRLFVPQMAEEQLGGGATELWGFDYQYDRPASYEMTTWVFPSEYWYEEQEALTAQGFDTTGQGGLHGGF